MKPSALKKFGRYFLLLMVSYYFQSFSLKAQDGLETGTYFIVNDGTGKALTPFNTGINSICILKDFKKSGLQKWSIEKHVSKTKAGKKIISYTIQQGSDGFFLRPYHIPDNGNAMISDKDAFSSFSIESDGETYIIKNIKMGGDVLRSVNNNIREDDVSFAPDAEKTTYRWRIIEAK